jgi:hypothetical protein
MITIPAKTGNRTPIIIVVVVVKKRFFWKALEKIGQESSNHKTSPKIRKTRESSLKGKDQWPVL